jgi:murein DD-endopeptidase MepM/ murein hydrolase activator NlpD
LPRSAWIAVAVATLVVGAGVVRAEPTGIDRAAGVDRAAVRLDSIGEGLLFPIDPAPMCEIFNNFGGYSKTFGNGGHQGVDIGAQLGQEVYAVESGVLYREFSSRASGIGWGLWSDSDTKYRYFHLDAVADGLVVGDRVVEGQLIGYVGDSGNANSGGWHLHFEVRPGPEPHATPVDPVPLFEIPPDCNVY